MAPHQRHVVVQGQHFGQHVQWGLNIDMPVPGYHDGDLKTDVAVYRFSESRWYYVHSSTGSGFWTAWGQSGAQPAVPFARP